MVGFGNYQEIFQKLLGLKLNQSRPAAEFVSLQEPTCFLKTLGRRYESRWKMVPSKSSRLNMSFDPIEDLSTSVIP